jgi:hypothetical protein
MKYTDWNKIQQQKIEPSNENTEKIYTIRSFNFFIVDHLEQ